MFRDFVEEAQDKYLSALCEREVRKAEVEAVWGYIKDISEEHIKTGRYVEAKTFLEKTVTILCDRMTKAIAAVEECSNSMKRLEADSKRKPYEQ